MKRHKFVLGILILTLAVSAVILVQGSKAADPNQSRVRVVHAVPGGPAVDVWVDGEEVYSSVSYKTVAPYVSLSVGPHMIQVIPAGWPMPVISETLILTDGIDFTVIGVGQDLNVTAVFLEDNNDPSNSNTVRLVHLSPDTSAIDVAITGTMTSTIASNIPFTRTSGYVGGLGVGLTSFEVRPAGQITSLLTFSRTLEEDTINTFFIMGLTTPPGSAQFPLEAVHSVDQRFFRTFLPVILRNS